VYNNNYYYYYHITTVSGEVVENTNHELWIQKHGQFWRWSSKLDTQPSYSK